MRIKLISFLWILLLIAGCTAPAAAPVKNEGALWPDPDWSTGTPESQGFDPAVLALMQDEIKSSRLMLDSLLIVRNGVLVSETYYNGSSASDVHSMYSVTKSVTATLIGIAFDQGKLRIDQTVADLLPGRTFANPDPRKQAMTVEDLLTMSSGLAWEENDASYSGMYRSHSWTQWVLDLPQVEDPGKTFKYCSGCSHVLSAMLNGLVDDQEKFARENLFDPLGIKNYRWELDAQRIPIGGWGLYLTARDMARLGYLYLHAGRWKDRQIISSSWVQAATTQQIKTNDSRGYGYQWWTFPAHGAYAALGRGGQTIYIIPDLNIIVVTTANLSGGHDPIFNLIDEYIIPAVKD